MEGLFLFLAVVVVALLCVFAIIAFWNILYPTVRRNDPELRDLEITTRTIRRLLTRGEIDAATVERVEQCLEAHRRALQPRRVARPVRPAHALPGSSLSHLHELLRGGVHPRDLSNDERRAALVVYRRLNNSQRTALKGPMLLSVARLLEMAGMTSHALNAYHRLLDRPDELPEPPLFALEAARLALREEQFDEVRRFLRVALEGKLLEPQHEEAQVLLRQVNESVRAPAAVVRAQPEEILDAIPVAPDEVLTVAPAPPRPAEVAVVVAPPPPPPTEAAVVVTPSPRPRRSLTNVLAAFMEDRNILWGELAGGLLIVGCSIALVITLWHSLEELPYFPFLIFAFITAALFGAGEYTLHHWKLESTSRGLLVISLLLVPLNLLVLADPSLGHANTALEWTFKITALSLSLGLVRLAGRDLIGVGVLPGPIDRRWLFMLAIVGAAGSQLVVPHMVDEDHPLLYAALGCLPVACHLLACGAVVAGLARATARAESKRMEVRQAYALFVFLGLASFALFVALGFLISRSQDLALALPRLAEPFALVGIPIVAGGLLVRHGLPHEDMGPRTAGTAVAFTGLAFMLAAVVLAWPQPLPLLLVCLSNAVLLSVLAFRWRMPYAHAVALPCVALAVLIVGQFSLGNLAAPPDALRGWWLAEQLLSPSSGIILASLMLLLTAGAEGLARSGKHIHALSYALGTSGLGLVALLITAWHGIDSPRPAALVHGLCAACALGLYVRWRRRALTYLGVGLIVVASLWGLWAEAPYDLALWGFALALEASLLAAAAVPVHSLRSACRDVAAVTLALALTLALCAPYFPAQTLHTGTAGLLALTTFLLTLVYRRAELAYLGSAFLFAAVAHFLMWDLGDHAPPRPLLMACLTHATLALLGALLLKAPSASDGAILRRPLQETAVLTSLLAVPLLFVPGVSWFVLAGYILWLAILWLSFAVQWRSPAWFSAFQLAVSAAVVFAVNAWLPERAWFEPESLHAYGIGLGLLGLGWVATRMTVIHHPRVRELWEADWLAVDRLILGVLVVGELALALWGIVPGVDAELIPDGFVSVIEWPAIVLQSYGPGAWWLLGVLALVLLTALREKGRDSIILGLLLVALTVPMLVAGPFASQLATASALRWGLALCYLFCSALFWMRHHLARLANSAGVTFTEDSSVGAWIQAMLGAAALSVLLLTAQVAVLGFSGLHPSGPAAGSWFAEIGWTVSHVVPLVVLTLGLVGFAIRERSPIYAFLGGLVANLSATGGYALAVVTSGRSLEIADTVCLWQLGSLVAALWAIGWLASRPWLYAWRESHRGESFVPSPLSAPLMHVQLGIALVGQLVLLALVLDPRNGLLTCLQPAAGHVGSLLGWLAFTASLTALFFRYALDERPLPWGWLYAGGLAAVSLLAASLERASQGMGFPTLLVGWPIYVLLCSLLPGATRRKPSWVSLTGLQSNLSLILLPCLAVVVWALNAAGALQEYAWAAAAVLLCSVATAAVACWRRSQHLAFLAGLGANLAASLLVWQLYKPHPPEWTVLVQVNLITSSLVTLLWLGIRRWLGEYALKPFLVVQSLLAVVVQTIWLLPPLLRVCGDPNTPLDSMFHDYGSVMGWLALLLSALAAYGQVAIHTPRGRLDALGVTGLSAGVLAACSVGRWDSGNWLSLHILLLTWCALGMGLAIAGSLAVARRESRFAELFQPPRLYRWLEGIGLAILTLTLLRAGNDPLRPFIPAAAVATVSVMAGMLALWSRRPHYVWVSGLLIDLVGVLFWSVWGPDTLLSFLLTNALGLAVASSTWTVVRAAWTRLGERESPPPITRRLDYSFIIFAANAALVLVVSVVHVLLASDLEPPRMVISGASTWSTLAAVGVALALALWDRRAGFAPPGLYILGLAAVGLGLHELTQTPTGLGWCAALALAGYVLLASIVIALLPRRHDVWIVPAQTIVAGFVIALSLWMCLDFAGLVDRLAGPAAVLLLVPATVVLIRREDTTSTLTDWLRPAALILGVIAVAEMSWAFPDPGDTAAWLHRNVLLMVALAGMTALYGVALPRWLARDAAWVQCGRRFGPMLGVLAGLTLLVLLVQEFRLYDAVSKHTPMAWPEILVVTVALITLMLSGIRFAVVPGREPFGLSERGRTIYVYAVELLLVLLFLHNRLNVPQLFSGWGAKYWTILVMLIAYIGVGLSEFFERRKLRVLAEPLQRTGVFLPLLPLLAFWAKPPAPLMTFADTQAPGLRPILGYLEKLPQHFDNYAFLWLLVCGLYGLVSLTRRSFVFALMAALAANFALWSLFAHEGIAFLLHPQCWLIPPALILLAAEHATRDSLRPQLSAGLRYLGISMIYVSSTADLFIAGLGESYVLPIVLAVLSLAGILLGILFRVRAFLFLGISFLFLDVFTMIWYAATRPAQTWVWWVSGIVLGAAILTLFAVFEKRRNDVLHLIEEIKQWH